MRIEIYSDSLKPAWDNFVRNSKNGTFLFLRDYMEYHRDRFTDHSLLVRDDKGRLIALLPANKHHRTLASHGGLTYGGFITDATMNTPLMLDVFEHAVAFLRQHSFDIMVYKTIPYIYTTLPSEEDRYVLAKLGARLARRGVMSVLGSSNRPKWQERRRRGVKKAVAGHLRVELSEDWEGYWAVLTDTLASAYDAKPVHSLDEIRRLHSLFSEHIKLYACLDGRKVLGGVVIYETDRVARSQYIAAGARGKELGALDLTFHFLLNEIYSHKPFFDFGTSDEEQGKKLNTGLIEQKEGFGARTVVQDHYEVLVA